MKNLIGSIFATATIFLSLVTNCSAQELANNAKGSTVNTNSTESKNTDVTNQVVANSFSTLFPAATSQRWTTKDNNTFVSFLNNGKKANASFSLKGKLNYVITECELEHLPASFIKEIKKDYASYKLYNAIEVKAHDAVSYQAVLVNELDFITLKFTDGGVEKIQQLKKAVN